MFCTGCSNALVAGAGGECVECGSAAPKRGIGPTRAGASARTRNAVAGSVVAAGLVIMGAGIVVLGEVALALAQELRL